MHYDGILSKGFHREEFAVQIEQLKQLIDRNMETGKTPDTMTMKMMQQMEEMQRKNYANPIFLLAYTLLARDDVYRWSGQLTPDKKQEWRELYEGSDYDCREYTALFDMRKTAELDWLTGLLLSTSKGNEEDYHTVIDGISRLYPTQKHFIKKRDSIRQEEIREYIENEENELLKAGSILLFIILTEYFQIPIVKRGSWGSLELVLWKGLQFYQNCRQPEFQKLTVKVKPFLDNMMIRQGIHPLSLAKYENVPFTPPEKEDCGETDWNYLWNKIYAMTECLWDDKECYRQLKQSGELTDHEQLNRQIEELQREHDRQEELILQHKNREKELLQHLDRVEKEKKEYQLEAETRAKDAAWVERELIQLRNFVYELESEEISEDNDLELAVAKLREKKILVIGGHTNWQQRMKELFPQWSFLSGFQTHFSVKSMNSVQYFLVNTRMIKHKGYYRLLSECDSRQSVLYCDEVNIEKSIRQIYGQLIHR